MSEEIFLEVIKNCTYEMLCFVIIEKKDVYEIVNARNESQLKYENIRIENYFDELVKRYFANKLIGKGILNILLMVKVSRNYDLVFIIISNYVRSSSNLHFEHDFNLWLDNLNEEKNLFKVILAFKAFADSINSEYQNNFNVEYLNSLSIRSEKCRDMICIDDIIELVEYVKYYDFITEKYRFFNIPIGVMVIKYGPSNHNFFFSDVERIINLQINNINQASSDNIDYKRLDKLFSEEFKKYAYREIEEKIFPAMIERAEIFDLKQLPNISNYQYCPNYKKLKFEKYSDDVSILRDLSICYDEKKVDVKLLVTKYDKLFDYIKKSTDKVQVNGMIEFEQGKEMHISYIITHFMQIIYKEISSLYEYFENIMGKIVILFKKDVEKMVYLNYRHCKEKHNYDLNQKILKLEEGIFLNNVLRVLEGNRNESADAFEFIFNLSSSVVLRTEKSLKSFIKYEKTSINKIKFFIELEKNYSKWSEILNHKNEDLVLYLLKHMSNSNIEKIIDIRFAGDGFEKTTNDQVIVLCIKLGKISEIPEHGFNYLCELYKKNKLSQNTLILLKNEIKFEKYREKIENLISNN